MYINTYGILYEEEKVKFLLCSQAIVISVSWEKNKSESHLNGRSEPVSLSLSNGKDINSQAMPIAVHQVPEESDRGDSYPSGCWDSE